MQVGQGVLGYLAAGCAAEEEGCFGVLEGFGSFLVERSFAACVAGFSGCVSLMWDWREGDGGGTFGATS